jgi:hypothetical protein
MEGTYLEVPCEGRCGEVLPIPINVGIQFFTNKGRLKPGVFIVCIHCHEWFEKEVTLGRIDGPCGSGEDRPARPAEPADPDPD